MVRYEFRCDDDHVSDVWASMAEPPDEQQVCDTCGGVAYRVWGARIDVFETMNTDHITGQKVEITSKLQRDSLLKEHHLTLDGQRYNKPKPPTIKKELEKVMPDIIRANRRERARA